MLLFSSTWSLPCFAQDPTPPPTAPPKPDPTPAKDPFSELTPEERKALEESLQSDAEAQPQPPTQNTRNLIQPNIPVNAPNTFLETSFILDVALAYFTDNEPLQTGAHDPNGSGFTLQQLEMSLHANIDPFFTFTSNVVFAQFGVEVEEAYATTTALPYNLQLRTGQFLYAFGRLNGTHPHAWDFVDQPIVNGTFLGGEGARGLGVEASWLSPLPWFLELKASTGDSRGECCARSFYGGENPPIDDPQDLLNNISLRQFFPFSDDVGLLLGLSALLGPNASGQNNRTEIYGVDLNLRYRPPGDPNRSALTWQTEAMTRRRQIPDGVLVDHGLYSQLVWNIHFMWAVGARYEHLTAPSQGDPLDPERTDTRHRTSLQATFYPSHFSRLRAQYAFDQPTWQASSHAFMLALEIVSGSHGSHDY